MSGMILRVQHETGQCRIEISANAYFEELYKKLKEKLGLNSDAFPISFDNRNF